MVLPITGGGIVIGATRGPGEIGGRIIGGGAINGTVLAIATVSYMAQLALRASL